jgi:hypothetical protein
MWPFAILSLKYLLSIDDKRIKPVKNWQSTEAEYFAESRLLTAYS